MISYSYKTMHGNENMDKEKATDVTQADHMLVMQPKLGGLTYI